MDRRGFLKLTAASTLSGTLLASDLNAVAGQFDFARFKGKSRGNKPDVVVICTDQWDARCTSYSGNPDVKTPNAEQIAKNGINFSNCYSNGAKCVPARCSMISGLYPHSHGVWSNHTNFYMNPDIAPMFRDIRKTGYFTAQIGKLDWFRGNKWKEKFGALDDYYKALGLDYCEMISTPFMRVSTPVLSQDSPPPSPCAYERHLQKLGLLEDFVKDMNGRLLGNQYVVEPSIVKPEDHVDHFIADKGVQLIESIPKDVPFCTVISLPGPHPPMDAPGKYATMYDPNKITLPENIEVDFKQGGNFHNEEDLRKYRANYYGKITMIDDCIGKIVEAIKKRGTYENTLIMVISDHGEMMGSHGRLGKSCFWEEAVRVPFIMQWPANIKANQACRTPVQWFDVYATIVDAIGGKLSENVFARSVLPIATGKVKQIRKAAFSETGGKTLNYMVRLDKFKWFVHGGKEYLFDLENDPWERVNLIDNPRYKPLLEEVDKLHLEFLRQTQLNLSRNYISLARRVEKQAERKGNN